MIEVNGKYSKATIFTDLIEDNALEQINNLVNAECSLNSKIAIMSDVHSGNGCTIGTTMTITDKVVPNLVGVDIGCGMLVVELADKEIDFGKLDKVIREKIPSGFSIRHSKHPNSGMISIDKLHCVDAVNLDRAYYSVGTLGGGNHFIEIDKNEDGTFYLVIHSGSRNLGKQVAEYWQKEASKYCKEKVQKLRANKLDELKNNNDYENIETELHKIEWVSKDLEYLEGDLMVKYLDDMEICQYYANVNRVTMSQEIVNSMNFTTLSSFTTMHNYIGSDNILRKGAVRAGVNELLIIPLNMRDGSIIASGKGNPDWNYSAPHGAGRIMGRKAAKRTFKLTDFKESMKGIYSTSVTSDTIDESPFVYKPMNAITDYISDTVEIVEIVKPVYNFKAS
jgi:RNA-splicing ligase RtcB